MAMLSVFPARRGFGLRMILNVLILSAIAWYLVIGPGDSSQLGSVTQDDGRVVDIQVEADDLAKQLDAQGDRLRSIVETRQRERAAERGQAARWLEEIEAPPEPLARGGVRINRGLPGHGGDGVIRVPARQ